MLDIDKQLEPKITGGIIKFNWLNLLIDRLQIPDSALLLLNIHIFYQFKTYFLVDIHV